MFNNFFTVYIKYTSLQYHLDSTFLMIPLSEWNWFKKNEQSKGECSHALPSGFSCIRKIVWTKTNKTKFYSKDILRTSQTPLCLNIMNNMHPILFFHLERPQEWCLPSIILLERHWQTLLFILVGRWRKCPIVNEKG